MVCTRNEQLLEWRSTNLCPFFCMGAHFQWGHLACDMSAAVRTLYIGTLPPGNDSKPRNGACLSLSLQRLHYH